MDIVVLYGTEKLSIPFCSDDTTLTIERLSTEIEKRTELPFDRQKLIFKGKCLSDKSHPLSNYGIKNGSKIMMLGRKNSLEENNILQNIGNIENQLTKLESTLRDLAKTSQDIDNGWLQGSLKEESIYKLATSLEITIEKCMKLVHELDDMQLLEHYLTARNKRKRTIDRIMQNLSEADKLFEIINRVKLECPSVSKDQEPVDKN